MDYTNILSSASSLRNKSLYKVTINESTRDILIQLNTTIMNAHDIGLSKISYKLPINFRQIDNSVSNVEIQTAVYYNVITELEKKDYLVRLQFRKEYTILEVSWTMRAAISDLDNMKRKIMSLNKHD